MGICPHCGQRLWPFLVAVFIAVFVAFITGLTLASVGMTGTVVFGWAAAAFLGVWVLLSLYMFNCMRRHCRHDPPRGV